MFWPEMRDGTDTWNSIIEVSAVVRNGCSLPDSARLKPSPSYCSKATVGLLVSHLWALSVSVWRRPPGIPFLYPSDFSAALNLLLRGSKGREGGGWVSETKSGGGRGEKKNRLIFIAALVLLWVVSPHNLRTMSCVFRCRMTGNRERKGSAVLGIYNLLGWSCSCSRSAHE